ncbi:hypothetical protein NQ318_021003 [Aromia moschata]|uniref:Uncharacterized protein n=1 Tax=Aromia moschata TaxID=1265417 RepID=A0AAV8YPL5_9CUCU|nr:hypothetical protein NQ318_021003 [Aromia moschata]
MSEEVVKSDDDLMNYAIVGSVREENSEGSDSPKSLSMTSTQTDLFLFLDIADSFIMLTTERC